jgi:hypothetical protein
VQRFCGAETGVVGAVGGGVKVVEKRRFENPAAVSLERSNFEGWF